MEGSKKMRGKRNEATTLRPGAQRPETLALFALVQISQPSDATAGCHSATLRFSLCYVPQEFQAAGGQQCRRRHLSAVYGV